MRTEKITCPYCERSFDLDQIEMADLFRERNTLAARLGPAWRAANEYLDAFRQKPGGKITLKKRTRHLKGLVTLWETGEFEVQGKRYRTTQRQIMEALWTVCNMEKYGFQNHNYLKKILLNGAERISAEGLTAEEEQKREDERRNRSERKGDLEPVPYDEFAKGGRS